MSDNLKEMLQSLLKEALEPIHEQFGQVHQRLDGVDQHLDGIHQRLDRMETDIAEIKKDTVLIPLIQRAVLETAERVDHLQNDVIACGCA